MNAIPGSAIHSSSRPPWLVVILTTLLAVAVGCSGDDDDAAPADPDAAAGQELALAEGCVACHGVDGEGGTGPPWVGLMGSELTLESGEVVVADVDYVTRAISDPTADLVEGYEVAMPENDLTASEIESVVAYIESLAS